MEKIKDNVLEIMGKTPLVRISKINTGSAEIVGKLEYLNPGGSVKDRIARSMIEDAEKCGEVTKDTVIIEPTSGNTGIGLAMVCAVKGYRLILTMPDSMSIERRNLLKAYGAEIVLTPGELRMKGAIDKAEELRKEYPSVFIPQQFTNKANPKTHEENTAQEIIDDTGGKIDFFIAGVGSGGTITGVGRALKKYNEKIQIIAVEPEYSAVLSGGKAGMHRIQGIGAGFIPEIVDKSVIDRIVTVTNEEAYETTRSLAKNEGILGGISAGAAVSAAIKISKEKGNAGKRIVVLIPDSGERYLSAGVY